MLVAVTLKYYGIIYKVGYKCTFLLTTSTHLLKQNKLFFLSSALKVSHNAHKTLFSINSSFVFC